MTEYSKRLDLCLAVEDERLLSHAIREKHPSLAVVLDADAQGPKRVLTSIELADRNEGVVHVWLCDKSVFPDESIGIQYVKPLILNDRFRAGRLAVAAGGFSEPVESANNEFIRDVWSAVAKLTTAVQCVDEGGRVLNNRVNAFRAGLHAAEWLRKKPGRFFTDTSRNLYVPLETARKRVARKESKS